MPVAVYTALRVRLVYLINILERQTSLHTYYCCKKVNGYLLATFLLLLNVYASSQTWTTANAGSWSNPATWTANAVPPVSGSLGTVNIGHAVTLDQNATLTTLNINTGTFSVSGPSKLSVSGTATVASGATFTNSSSNVSNISIANFVVSNGGTYNHDAVGSSANGASTDFPGSTSRSFGASSNVVITKWANGGAAPTPLPASSGQGWGNLTINIASLGGTYWQQSGGLTKVQGDFTLKNTANKELSLFNSQSGGTSFLKNVYLEGGTLGILQNGNGNGINITISGNLSMSGNGILALTAAGGTFGSFNTSEPRIFLRGNLSITNAAQILQSKTLGVVAIFVFKKPSSGIQYFTCDNPTGVSDGYIGWGVGDENGAGAFTNTLILNSNFIAKDFCVFRVFKGATLQIPGEIYIKGAGASGIGIGSPGFTVYSGGIIKIGSKNGITTTGTSGNIQTSGARNFDAGANYIYNGAYNQVTGNGLPSSITGSLTVANTGAMGDNTVTLTTNNTQTAKLNLSSGYFAAGTGQTLRIANNGIINGTAGGDCIYSTASGGNIWLQGNNTVTGSATGYPHFYDITIGNNIASSPVTFSNNGTIYHYCTINIQGSVNPNAPTYATGSTLIYNPGGTYNRSIEWGNNPGLPGYPWHVLVQNGTTLNLGNSTPTLLECGGDFTIGKTGSGTGTVNMNSLSQPLVVKGHLTIGDTTTAGSPTGSLTLSSNYGGDLWLYGNFSRGKNSTYTDNNRAIYFKGATDATINTPGITITPGVPSQNFSYVQIDKTTGTTQLYLNCPIGVTQEINFNKGIVNSNNTNLLNITATAGSSVVGGSIDSYVNGPLKRYTSPAAGSFLFPIGSYAATRYKPLTLVTLNDLASGSQFTGQYFYSSPPLAGSDFFLSSLVGIVNKEYWQLDRNVGSSTGTVVLPYTDPGSNNWRDASGNIVSPCSDCYVSVVKRSASSGSGNWDFTGPGIFSTTGNPPESRLYTDNGNVISKELSSFSPFTLGYVYNVVLPVRLLHFTGQLVNDDGKFDWEIADSDDLAFFELQVSSNGRDFIALARINENGSYNYQYIDEDLAPGVRFYRLLVIEKTGHSFYSRVVVVSVGDFKTVITGILQNPVKTQLTIQIESAFDQRANAIITDAVGRRVGSYKEQLQAGENKWDISTALLPKGIYFINITTGKITATYKFIRY